MTDPAAAHRAAVAAERERLARARERRRSRGPAGVSGFAQRKWRWLGVAGSEAVEAVHGMLAEITRATALSEDQRNTLTRALEGTPDREVLLPAVRAGLASLPPEAVLRHLRDLWAAGVRWLNEPGLERCRVLCSTAPGAELVGRRARAVSGGPAFSLFVTAATRGAVPVPNRFLEEVLSWAPLSVVDELVEHGGLLAEDEPWRSRDEAEALYLRARLAPTAVTRQEAERLGWDSYLRRCDFLNGGTPLRREPEDVWDLLYDVVVDGDLSSIDALDAALPRAQQIELRNIRSGALTGQWSLETVADRGLWLLMSTLWQPGGPVDPTRSAFHALIALNRAYDLVKSGDLEAAARQARSFTGEDGTGRNVPAPLLAEAYTIAAYTAAVEGSLAAAEEHARKAAERGGDIAERNLALVLAWRATTKNDRGPVTNPFLEIGLDHGSTRWEQHCREIFVQREGDQAGQARLNQAEDRIRGALRSDAGWDVFFQIPLDHSRYVMPTAVPRQLIPPLEPLPRRTSVTSGADLEAIRARAAVELIDDFRTTAPHLDRHDTAL
ncbi:hypothetical protein L7D48_04260 [Streptomyces sp. S1A]|uniref:hypothetical protein n=1 Tax=Streptomyces sp. ICN903 TaxID=2964654 RepID=UPI001EDA8EB4|nr:hypothetical protein [Streptomyces sp. ICN903]MCG3039789.1 hypothetical protein [Streptomyces sp. ICN903]